MDQLKGVYIATKKDGTQYYRASITYKNKHISLGSFTSAQSATLAYQTAHRIILPNSKTEYRIYKSSCPLSFEKWIILHNFRDNGYYMKTPIYMHKYYFSYFLSVTQELEFDAEDLFFYSTHKIFKRNGYLFVNNYGTQMNILSRYGVKNFAVAGKDFVFKDGNPSNLRYHNIEIVNPYHGVERILHNNEIIYRSAIHIHGNYLIGKYKNPIHAAISYNKAADFLNKNKISPKDFPRNFIEELNTEEYKSIYLKLKLPTKILELKL